MVNAETFTEDLKHYCAELDSMTANLQLCLQIKEDHSENMVRDTMKHVSEHEQEASSGQKSQPPSSSASHSSISLGSVVKASQRLRDMSLVNSGYLLCRNGQLLVQSIREGSTGGLGGGKAECAMVNVFRDCTLGLKFDK